MRCSAFHAIEPMTPTRMISSPTMPVIVGLAGGWPRRGGATVVTA